MADTEFSFSTGSQSAFDDFYRANEPLVRRALTAAFGPTVGADAAAEAMSYGFEHWDRVGQMDNPVGYLFAVGRSRSRSRRKPLPPLPPSVVDEPRIEPGLPAALNRLSESQRSCVLLVNAWGYSLPEAAGVLGISVSTLRNHLERGMSRLRRQLGVDDDV